MSKSIEFGCPKCDRMFNSVQEMDAHFKEHENQTVHFSKYVEPEVKKEVMPKPPVPPQLTYLYKGTCPHCSTQVTTLEVDVANKHYCIAMCTRCNKQLETKEVVKL